MFFVYSHIKYMITLDFPSRSYQIIVILVQVINIKNENQAAVKLHPVMNLKMIRMDT